MVTSSITIGGDTLVNRELAREQNYGRGWAMGHKERQSKCHFVLIDRPPPSTRDLTDLLS
jgi:hypothetical protein